MLLAAWVAVAGALRADEALSGDARPLPDLVRALGQQLGLGGQPALVTVGLLAQLGELGLLTAADGAITIPWPELATASLAEASRRLAAAEQPGAAPAAAARQDPLPGFAA